MLGLGNRTGSVDKPLVASSAVELSSTEMFVFVKAAGLIGRFLGRDTKMRVDKFFFDYHKPQGANSPSELLAVRCAANSLLALSEVDANRFDRSPLTFEECVKMDRRTRSFVLDAERHPEILYTVESETATEINGVLNIRGHTAPLKCTKNRNEAELVVECGVKLSEMMVPTYGILGGMLRVDDNVLIQMRVPNVVLEKHGL